MRSRTVRRRGGFARRIFHLVLLIYLLLLVFLIFDDMSMTHLFFADGQQCWTMKHGLSWQTASLLHLIGSEGKRIAKIANTK